MGNNTDLERALLDFCEITGLELDMADVCKGGSEETIKRIGMLVKAYRDKYNREYFLKRVILGELDSPEVLDGLRRNKIDRSSLFSLFVVCLGQGEQRAADEVLRQMAFFPEKQEIVRMEEGIRVILRSDGDALCSSKQWAHFISDAISAEAMTPVKVVYSCRRVRIGDLAMAYPACLEARKIGDDFEPGMTVIDMENLGIGRLIYSLSSEVCQKYVEEILGEDCKEELEEELIGTAEAFFNHSLNVAETARQLHIHRNTLLYRIEQLKKRTGLDIRNFREASRMNMLFMIQAHMKGEK